MTDQKPGFTPGQELPEPEEHFTDDPLWKAKTKVVDGRGPSIWRNKSFWGFVLVCAAIVMLVIALRR